MGYTVGQIAEALGASAVGDTGIRIARAAAPDDAGDDALALAMQPEYAEKLQHSAARAAILWEGADWRSFGLEAAVFVPRPRYAMATITQLLDSGPEIAPGVPWTEALGTEKPLALALKSGNFGGPDFFQDALSMLDG